MDSKSLQEHAMRVALELPFTEHCWPFGPEFDVFKVGGKDFHDRRGRARATARQPEVRPGEITVKSADLSRDEPGYHLKSTGFPFTALTT
jgi:predicted DNA-binding protein (MmcQ/YjbR family)